MELEKMKAVWAEMSEQLDKQEKMTNEIIIKMAHEKSTSRLNRIMWMESIGMVLAVFFLLYLLFNFQKLNNWLNITGGIGSALILLLSIVMGGLIVQKANRIDVINNSYTQALDHFMQLKKMLRFYKKISIVINVIFPFFLLPVVFTLVLDKDLLTDFSAFGRSLLICFLLAPIVLYLIIKWYAKNVSQVKDAFEDLEDRA